LRNIWPDILINIHLKNINCWDLFQISLLVLETIKLFSLKIVTLSSRFKLYSWRSFILWKLYYFRVLRWKSLFPFREIMLGGRSTSLLIGLLCCTFEAYLYILGYSAKFGASVRVLCRRLGHLEAFIEWPILYIYSIVDERRFWWFWEFV